MCLMKTFGRVSLDKRGFGGVGEEVGLKRQAGRTAAIFKEQHPAADWPEERGQEDH